MAYVDILKDFFEDIREYAESFGCNSRYFDCARTGWNSDGYKTFAEMTASTEFFYLDVRDNNQQQVFTMVFQDSAWDNSDIKLNVYNYFTPLKGFKKLKWSFFNLFNKGTLYEEFPYDYTFKHTFILLHNGAKLPKELLPNDFTYLHKNKAKEKIHFLLTDNNKIKKEKAIFDKKMKMYLDFH